MIVPRNLVLALCLAAVARGDAAAPAHAQVVARGTTAVREQPAIRIPLRPMAAVPLPRPTADWKEGRAPRCIVPSEVAGALVNGPKTVDFILQNRTRIRARLQNSCPAIDYYRGFYLKPSTDGRVCRDRDAIHSRSGGECRIDAFRTLTPRGR